MKTTTRWTTAILFLMTLMLTACASGGGIDLSKLPPIVIAKPAPVPPVVETPAPKPRATLAFEVLDDTTGAPIATAFSTCDDGLPKQASDAGYIAVERDLGIYSCKFEADDYETVTRRYQLEGNRQFQVKLKSTKPAVIPAPPVPPVVVPPVAAPPPVAPLPDPVFFTACGPRANPTENRLECVRQVAERSAWWPKCRAGYDELPCHRFVLEIARALAAGDKRWGLITKRRGESSCTFDRCGDDLDNGYGEDMVAYLPDGAEPNRWLGADIIGCLGCPTPTDPNLPSYHWPSEFHPETNRAHNLWAPVPPIR